MADISAPALEKARAKVLQLVPDAKRVEILVGGVPAEKKTTLRPCSTRSFRTPN